MSVNKILNPGFGIGNAYGTPFNVTVAGNTITLTSTASTYTGQFYMTGVTAGVNVNAQSTSNGVTGTYAVLSGAAGIVVMDNTSFNIQSAATATIVLIPLN